MTKADVANAIMQEVHSGLHVYCSIPGGYTHCTLEQRTLDIDRLDEARLRELLEHPPGEILNPKTPHSEAIEFFNMILEGHSLVTEGSDCLRPTVGAYLQGPPGVGKTHIMAAFGRWIEFTLHERLKELMLKVRSHIDIFWRQYQVDLKEDKLPAERGTVYKLTKEDIEVHKRPHERFEEAMAGIKRLITSSAYQPTDMLYLGFEDLCQLYSSSDARKDAIGAIESAPIVFVDDLHGKGDPERLLVIQRLIERRYELKRFGTFLTTNIDVEHIGGDDVNVGKRILSRSKESFAVFDFTGCVDWREEVKQRKIRLIREEIKRRIAARAQIAQEQPPETIPQEPPSTEEPE
ncbi:MAG: hypothetical protein Q7R81_03840 [Candidatus Peregrinibacteria bacterium]|nr:hypothetical protein [Candidatus Peregrinibacteria bacterium]